MQDTSKPALWQRSVKFDLSFDPARDCSHNQVLFGPHFVKYAKRSIMFDKPMQANN